MGASGVAGAAWGSGGAGCVVLAGVPPLLGVAGGAGGGGGDRNSVQPANTAIAIRAVSGDRMRMGGMISMGADSSVHDAPHPLLRPLEEARGRG